MKRMQRMKAVNGLNGYLAHAEGMVSGVTETLIDVKRPTPWFGHAL
jgi:hypothetical protein